MPDSQVMKLDAWRPAPVAKTAAYELRLWMLEHDVSVKVLAGEMRTAESIVTGWRTGKHKPNRPRAVRLEELTSGRVTAASWDETKEAT